MDNKLSELSKPVMYSIVCNGAIEEIGGNTQAFSAEECQRELDSEALGYDDAPGGDDVYSVSALYSQEYVSALLQRIAELEKKELQGERQNVIDGMSGAGEAWSDIEEYMVKWDEERRNG